MVQPGLGSALDTPRTNLGDATYLDHQPDFADISQEATFISPSKDGNNNLLQQMRNGGRANLRTPRQPFADRRNLPQSIGGAEFTPLLKSATRNSVRRGKTSTKMAPATPALNRIEEDDMTPLPQNDASMYTGSRSQSYLDHTLPHVETSSATSTPLAMPTRRGADKGPLQDGNGLSLREQENAIDRIEKENFGLKLKIHFLEEALRKAGPGFGEAALKENTELKVDKVTMQRELHRYKKNLTGAEKDLETYRQQMEQLQAKAARKISDQGLEEARRKAEETAAQHEEEVQDLKRQIEETGLSDDLRAELEQLREQKAAIEEELEDARYEHRQEVEQLETDHEKEVARLTRQIEEGGQSEDLEAQIEELKEQKTALEEDLEDARYEARQEAEKMSTDHEKEVADLQRQLENGAQSEHLDAQIEDLKEQKADLEADLEEVRHQSRREVEELEAEHEKEVQRLKRQIEEASSAPELEARIQDLEDEKKAQEQDFMTQIQEIKKQKATFEDDLKFKLQRVEDQKFSVEEELKGKVQALEEEKVALEEDFEDAHRQVEEINAEHEREVQGLKRQLIGNESTARDLQLQIQDLEDQKFSLEADLKEARRHADELTSQHDREIDRLKRQLIEGSSSSQDVQKQLKELESEKSSLREDLKEARRQAEEVKAQHEQAIQDLKRQVKSAGSSNDDQVRELEDQKVSLEDALKEAHHKAEKAASLHERTVRDLKRRIDNVGSSSDQVNELESQKLDLEEALEDERQQARKAASQHERAMRDLQRRLDLKSSAASSDDQVQELEEQKISLEEALEDARRQAERAASQHERTVRDLKRRLELRSTAASSDDQIQELEDQKNALEEALEQARREAEKVASQHQRAMRDLKRQVDHAGSSDDQLHDLEDQKVMLEEILEEARQQAESTATQHKQAVADLKRQIQEAASSQDQLHDLEDEKVVLEEVLEEERHEAEEKTAQHERAMRAMKRKLEKAERDHKAAQSSHKSERHLLKSQAEVENLEHDVRQQQETIDALMASEGSLRRKLERVRSERAAYRMSAEKLQRGLSRAQKTSASPKRDYANNGSDEAITTIVRAAEGAEERHKKEIRGMVTQMEWMQKRWERESSLRSDAAYAKRFLQLQLDVANKCNNAQLRELESIRTNLLGSRKSLHPLPSTLQKQKLQQDTPGKPRLKTFLVMARFVARMKISAREWEKQEKLRRKLVAATEESRRKGTRDRLQVVRVDERAVA